MENKPIITCHGDQTLFSSIHSTLQTLLPSECVEWKRSYGRARTVYVEAVYVPFSPEILPENGDCTSLIGQPCFHIYWTDCDADTYKSLVRDDINRWLTDLKLKDISDWLIVVVNTEDKKSKLLPRSSVIDKVKNDFCSKSSDRMISLFEPLKNELRSQESWHQLTVRLRTLILQSFTRHINKFEENMRFQRERRNELGWNFSQYFMLQEELAFTFEMFGLFEDSLVQYDELDALFTQFVVNHAAGETAQWMSSFSQHIHRWPGVDLSQLINQQQRQLIKENSASLLDFRNYLFSRQCAMLFMLYRPWEVAQRSIPFMHNCLQELASLELNMPAGSMSSWVFLTCLAVLDACERFADSGQGVDDYSLHTASLWEYARSKLMDLGKLCGLMPDSEPDMKHLNLVVDILAGIGEMVKMDHAELGPSERLSSALSSKEQFKTSYMELAELAMGTFKHIGRYRSARLIGKDLADFYIRLGEYAKAEVFLSDAYKTYKMESWERLADHTRIDIAKCQKWQNSDLKYIKSCCQLASSLSLDTEKRLEFAEELVRLSNTESTSSFRFQPIFTIGSAQLESKNVVLNQELKLKLKINNQALMDLNLDSLSVSYRVKTENENPKVLSRGSSVSSVTSFELQHQLTNIPIDAPPKSNRSNTGTSSETSSSSNPSTNFPSDVGKYYSHTVSVEKELIREDFTLCLKSSDSNIMVMKPGENELVILGKATKQGNFVLNQISAVMNRLEFLQSLKSISETFTVSSEAPTIQIETGKLFAGLTQTVNINLYTGSSAIAGAVLHISTDNESVKMMTSKNKTVTNNSVKVPLPLSETYQTIKTELHLFAPVAIVQDHETFSLKINCEKLDIKCEERLQFHKPLRINHLLLSAGPGGKFVKIDVENLMKDKVTLQAHELKVCQDTDDVQLKGLNCESEKIILHGNATATYIWKINSRSNEILKLKFSTQAVNCGGETVTEDYCFQLVKFNTIYNINAQVLDENSKECLIGNFCKFHVNIEKMDNDVIDQILQYKVLADDHIWSISGKTSGFIQMVASDVTKLSFGIIPLIAGNLPLPRLELLRPCDENSVDNDNEKNENIKKKFASFHRGEIYDSTLADHVQVLPKCAGNNVELSVV